MGVLSVHWHYYLAQFNLDPSKHNLTLWWLATLLEQLWNTLKKRQTREPTS